MPSLPVLSGREVVRVLAVDGWRQVRQRGSRLIRVKPGHLATLSVPGHREGARGALRSLIRSSGLPGERFLEWAAQ